MARTLKEITNEILQDWKKPYFGAVPYLDAMKTIDSSESDAPYYMETASDIVLYFLANAVTWRGETARKIKAELKQQYNIK